MKTFLASLIIGILLLSNVSHAQTAMQLSGADCNGVSHDLFADLNSGKAVILHFFMPNCGSCPPPAQKIQKMANNILANYPGKITAYAMPFNDVTSCTATASWVSNNSLSLYAPFDSGANQVAYYGGFGMPTVVLLGGANHRTMFKTMAFATSDTAIMRDSILALFNTFPLALNDFESSLNALKIYPNPTTEVVNILLDLKTNDAAVNIEMVDIMGKSIATIYNKSNVNGKVIANYNTTTLPNGFYAIRITVNGQGMYRKLNVVH
jgi:thiol-disulfide isomerase/thioredoxin